MSAAEAIIAARAAGVSLEIDGDDLVLEATAPPPDTVLDLLSRHKPDIVALLRPRRNGGRAEDADNVLLPFGIEGAAHLWLHSRCWPAWYARRKVQAFAALVAMGIA